MLCNKSSTIVCLAWGVAGGYKSVDVCSGFSEAAVAADDVGSAVTSKCKGSASPIRVWGRRVWVVLSHLPQSPTAASLSRADVAAESVHRVLPVEQESYNLCSPSRAPFLWAKGRDKTYKPLVPLSNPWFQTLDPIVTLLGDSARRTSSPNGTGRVFEPAQISHHREVWWKCCLGLSFCSFLYCPEWLKINQPSVLEWV